MRKHHMALGTLALGLAALVGCGSADNEKESRIQGVPAGGAGATVSKSQYQDMYKNSPSAKQGANPYGGEYPGKK